MPEVIELGNPTIHYGASEANPIRLRLLTGNSVDYGSQGPGGEFVVQGNLAPGQTFESSRPIDVRAGPVSPAPDNGPPQLVVERRVTVHGTERWQNLAPGQALTAPSVFVVGSQQHPTSVRNDGPDAVTASEGGLAPWLTTPKRRWMRARRERTTGRARSARTGGRG